MWFGGADRSEYGEAVLLYEPAATVDGGAAVGTKGATTPRRDASSSCVGGRPAYHPGDEAAVRRALLRPLSPDGSGSVSPSEVADDDGGGGDSAPPPPLPNPSCGVCGDPTVLVAQVHAPLEDGNLDRTVYVFGCNRGGCYSQVFRRRGEREAEGGGADGGEGGGAGEESSSETRARRFHVSAGAGAGAGSGAASPVFCVRSQRLREAPAPASARAVADDDIGSGDAEEGGGWVEDDDGAGAGADEDVGGWGNDDDGADDDDGGWGVDAVGGDADDDWGADTGDWGAGSGGAPAQGDDVDDLEEMLAKCEMNDAGAIRPKRKKKGAAHSKEGGKSAAPPTSSSSAAEGQTTAATTTTEAATVPALPRLEIDYYEEPPVGRDVAADGESDDDEDDENVGISASAGTGDDDKVNRMLSKYLAEEEDGDVVAAIRSRRGGGKTGCKAGQGGGKGGGGSEKYERLPPEHRAFLSFTDRIGRAPRQVARYAYGGVPLWSAPTPAPPGKKERRKRAAAGSEPWTFPPVPPCPGCGAVRTFELQLVPPLLLALDVDAHAPAAPSPAAASAEKEEGGAISSGVVAAGGMNWGALALYCCPDSCDASRTEVVVMQRDPADAGAEGRRRAVAAAVAAEGGGGGDDDDEDEDEDEEGGIGGDGGKGGR